MNNTVESIQVLGAGCPNCQKLYELTKQAVSELGLNVEVEYISDVVRMMSFGVMSSPNLVINDQVVMGGQIPSLEKIKELLITPIKTAPKSSSCGCCGGHC